MAEHLRGSAIRRAHHPIDPWFLDRWSPRAFSEQPLEQSEFLRLCEAARWAPSSRNGQPWRILYALNGGPEWPRFFRLLAESNQVWAVRAGALALFVSRKTFPDGTPSVTHSFDTGAAWANFALQAGRQGLITHAMQGFDYDKARVELAVPEDYHIEAMIAVGLPGDPQSLPENLQAREKPSDRSPVADWVFPGAFPAPQPPQ